MTWLPAVGVDGDLSDAHIAEQGQGAPGVGKFTDLFAISRYKDGVATFAHLGPNGEIFAGPNQRDGLYAAAFNKCAQLIQREQLHPYPIVVNTFHIMVTSCHRLANLWEVAYYEGIVNTELSMGSDPHSPGRAAGLHYAILGIWPCPDEELAKRRDRMYDAGYVIGCSEDYGEWLKRARRMMNPRWENYDHGGNRIVEVGYMGVVQHSEHKRTIINVAAVPEESDIDRPVIVFYRLVLAVDGQPVHKKRVLVDTRCGSFMRQIGDEMERLGAIGYYAVKGDRLPPGIDGVTTEAPHWQDWQRSHLAV